MKKTIKTMLAFMACAIALSACSSDDFFEEQKSPSIGNMTFTATVSDEEGEATRALLDGLKILWNQGDAISVFSGRASSTSDKMTLTSGEGTTSASFSGTCQKSDNYNAVYPYNKNHIYIPERGFLIYWNGAQQTAVAGSFQKNTPMMAQASTTAESSNVALNFKNVCSFVKVTTNYPCSKITLTAKKTDCVLVAERFFANFDNDGLPILSGNPVSTNSLSNSVSLTAAEGEIIKAGTYYIAVLPGTMTGGFDLTLTNAYDERTWTKSTTKDVVLTRGHILNLGTMDIKTEFVKLQGKGTAASPFLINDYLQLCRMRDFINKGDYYNAYFKQTRDIDGGGAEFTPIGNINTTPHRFNGTYDGGGFTIKNIKPIVQYEHVSRIEGYVESINHFYCRVAALFAFTLDATIKNLVVENIDLSALTDWDYTTVYYNNNIKSPLIGVAYGTEDKSTNIENVIVKGSYEISSWANCYTYGGFVAISYSNLNITNCSNYSTINCKLKSLNPKVGGFVGLATDVTWYKSGDTTKCDAYVNINKCRNYGDFIVDYGGLSVSSCYSHLGGIIGLVCDLDHNVVSDIKNCVNYGTIQIKAPNDLDILGNVGGIVGEMNSDGNISKDPYIQNCINNGSIIGFSSAYDRYSGGIIGYCYDDDTHIKYCANVGVISGHAHSKSIIGNRSGTISHTYNYYTGCYEIGGGEHTAYVGKGTTLAACIEWMNKQTASSRSTFCAWKYADGDNTKLDLDF